MADPQPSPNVGRPSRLQRIYFRVGEILGIGPQRAMTSQRGENYLAARRYRGKWQTDEVPAFMVAESPVRDAANIRLYAEMDEHVSFIQTALDIISEDATTDDTGQSRGFWLETKDSAALEALDNSPAIKREAEDAARFIRSSIKYGDTFLEHIFRPGRPQDGLIGLKEIYSGVMLRREDRYGRLLRYEQVSMVNDPEPIMFHPAEINHMRMNACATTAYGRSWLQSIRNDFRLWKQAIEFTHIAAQTRAPQRMKHTFQNWDETWIKEYQTMLERQIFESVEKDYYVAKDRMDVEAMPGDTVTTLAFMKYIESLEQRMKIPLKVPNLLMGYDSSIRGRDVSLTAERAYIKRLNSLRALYSKSVIYTIIVHLALMEAQLEPVMEEGMVKLRGSMHDAGLFNGKGDTLFQITPLKDKQSTKDEATIPGYRITMDAAAPAMIRNIIGDLRILWPTISIESAKEKVERLSMEVEKLGLSQRTALDETGRDVEAEREYRMEEREENAKFAPPQPPQPPQPQPPDQQQNTK